METIRAHSRLFFETVNHAFNVTFDDAEHWRRSLPWIRFAGAHWGHAEPDSVRIEIGEWLVVVTGHNLGPLFAAIEDQTLKHVRAHPEWENDHAREADTFATRIRFVRLAGFAASPKLRAASMKDPDLAS